MTDRHVLITGGAGYIGSILTSELLRANYRVTVLDSLTVRRREHCPISASSQFPLCQSRCDRASRSTRLRSNVTGRSQILLSILRRLWVSLPVRRWGSRWRGSTMSRPRKMSMVRQSDLGVERFVFASTYSNYGLSEDGKPVTEESPLNPQSLYAETKIASGGIFAFAKRFGLRAVVVPLCNIIWNFPAHAL